QYRLTRLLGRGGFADVYLGEQIYLESQAAIKVLSAPLAAEAISEFLKEARTLVRLAHPRIIRLLDYGVQEQMPFLVMEYAPGVIVYEWLSGTRPFSGSFVEIAAGHCLVEPPPLQEARLGIPTMVAAVVSRALAKRPEQRFASVQAFAAAFERAARLTRMKS